ncbi:MAG: cytochrome c family protein [Pseudomonadota bacterium]
MRLWKAVSVVAAAATIGLTAPVANAQDADAGARVFQRCAACHTFDPEARRPGPHLKGVFGRKAGTVEGFRYSSALKSSGIVWNEETLAAYISNPLQTVPGTYMAVGVSNEQQLQNVIAYLREEGGEDVAP